MLAAGLVAQGQNVLSLTGGSGHPGDTVTVRLALTNSDAVTALQTFIPLGSNLTYVAGSAALSNRSNGHQLTATVLRDTLRIYSYSLALAPYGGTSGELLTFRVVLGREPGNIALTPTQSVLSSDAGGSLTVGATSGTVTVLAPKLQVTPTAVDYGHVPIRSSYTRSLTVKNIGNEALTLGGATFSDTTLSCTLPTTLAAGGQQTVTLRYSPVRAGATTMTATLHSNAKVGDSVVTIAADPYAVNELRPLSVSGYTDSTVTVELRMNNMDSIVGLQTAIKLPQALTYVEGSFAVDATRTPSYSATAGMQGDTLTLLLTSLTATPMHGSDGVVARFGVRLHGYGSHTLRLTGTALSDEEGRNVLSGVYTGTVSIYSPTLSCNGSVDLGNTPVTETAAATLPVRNTGNAPLVIDRAVFTQAGWQIGDNLPLTVSNNGRDTLHIVYTGTREGAHSAQMLLYTNDPRNDLKRIDLTAQRYEPNALYLQGNPDAAAATPEVDIVLDNYSDVTALQMDVRYPHSAFSLEPQDISLTERADGHIVSGARLNDSTLRVLVLSMQNTPFGGNSGAVARMRLHAVDSLSADSYQIELLNVTSGCTDGVDRLSSIQGTGWFATRVVHDTTVVRDTIVTIDTIVAIDTIEIHDTTLVPYAVHDTTIIHDTTLVPYAVHDTTYIHDTTLVPYAVHDTTYITIHDTTLVPYAVHDTTYITIHDTTLVPYAVHDTIETIDTIVVIDTIVAIDTVAVYDTIIIHDTTVVVDTLWMTRYDTVYIYDTIYIPQEGIEDADHQAQLKVYPNPTTGLLNIDGGHIDAIEVFDTEGRRVALFTDANRVDISGLPSGKYLMRIRNGRQTTLLRVMLID